MHEAQGRVAQGHSSPKHVPSPSLSPRGESLLRPESGSGQAYSRYGMVAPASPGPIATATLKTPLASTPAQQRPQTRSPSPPRRPPPAPHSLPASSTVQHASVAELKPAQSSLPPPPVHHAVVALRDARAEQASRQTHSTASAKPRSIEPPAKLVPLPPKKTNIQPPPSHAPSHISLTRAHTDEGDEDAGPGSSSTDSESVALFVGHPDLSMANRRPPAFTKGFVTEIPLTGGDMRNIAVSGEYICITSSTSTQVYNASTLAPVWTVSHDGSKCTAIGFVRSRNPGSEFADMFWLGMKDGSIWEADIGKRMITNRHAFQHKAPVVGIYAAGSDMWTVDESGRFVAWHPDSESGDIDMKGPCDTYRLGPKFSHALVIGSQLWVGSGRQVKVFDPVAAQRLQSAFNVTEKPLSAPKVVSPIKSGCWWPGRDEVFFGHEDGSVAVYSRKKMSFLYSVNLFAQGVNTMAVICDRLWTIHENGMIYICDPYTTPWKVYKAWKAHKHSAVLAVDASCLWRIKRLQVVSASAAEVKFWDGFCMDDWLEDEMRRRLTQFCTFRDLQVAICTYNAGATRPPHASGPNDLVSAFLKDSTADVLVFGFQELVDLEDKRLTAKTLLTSKKKNDTGELHDSHSRQYKLWQEYLIAAVSAQSGNAYSHIISAQMVGLFTCVFAKTHLQPHIRHVGSATVKTGFAGIMGNKGGLLVRMVVQDTSICFVNAHLAAGQDALGARNANAIEILESASLEPERDEAVKNNTYTCGGDGSMVLDHELCFWSGDLNYRIAGKRAHVEERVKQGEIDKLLDVDQLTLERKRNPVLRLRMFHEARIDFAPTYKYNVGSSTYDTSEKFRVPAWCDRVLWHAEAERVTCLAYQRLEITLSDHRPVSAVFRAKVKTVNAAEKARTFELVAQEWKRKAQQAVTDTKASYLVHLYGVDPDEARRAIAQVQGSVAKAVQVLG